MELMVNSLIQYHGPDTKVERVLYLTPSHVVLFNINRDIAADPYVKLKEEVLTDLLNVKAHLLDIDPFDARLLISEENISEKARKKRNQAWELVLSIAQNEDGSTNVEIFSPSARAKLIQSTAEKYRVTSKTVLKYLRMYWRGKQVRNAMLSYYENCGGRGRHHDRTKEKKIGRANQLEKELGFVEPIYDSVQLRMIFQEGLDEFYKQGSKLTDILQKIIAQDFVQGYRLEGEELIPILYDEIYRPTYPQFYKYFCDEWKKDPEKYLRKFYGNRRFTLNHRAIKGESRSMAFGPGSIYQIDSTVCDIYLVSTFGREKIIGRPEIYVISDVFTTAVTGFCVTLENQSWIAALPSLDNAFSDKVQFCEEYGIVIDKDEWPAFGMPKRMIADRAELIGYVSNNLPDLGIRLSNTPPYRAEWKGIVERRIGIINKTAQALPGGVDKNHQRGDSDHRLWACLTPREFIKIMILSFLFFNNHHTLEYFVPDEFMIKDKVPLIPNCLWKWGIENRVGELQKLDRDLVRFNLLPTAEASITDKGFLYKKKIYHCDIPDLEVRMMIIAREKGRTKFTIVYDPRMPDVIYLQLEDRSSLIPLRLSQEYQAYKGLHEMEWEEQNEQDKYDYQKGLGDQQAAKAELDSRVSAIVNPAMLEAEQAKKGLPKSEITGNMKENREKDKAEERANTQNPSLEIAGPETQDGTKPNHPSSKRPNNLNLLRNVKKEAKNE